MTITAIQNQGSIILVYLSNGTYVPFDYRMFQCFIKDYPNPIGLKVKYSKECLQVL